MTLKQILSRGSEAQRDVEYVWLTLALERSNWSLAAAARSLQCARSSLVTVLRSRHRSLLERRDNALQQRRARTTKQTERLSAIRGDLRRSGAELEAELGGLGID